jgi:polyisoprenoid-binding protein YceI
MKTILTVWFALVLVISANAQSYFTEKGTAIFHSKVPLHTFSGTSERLTGLINLEDGTVDFYLDLETLDTGNAKRDKDMLLTLETDSYPFGEFYGTLKSDFDAQLMEAQEVAVEGTFKIHGKEQKVVITGTLTPAENTLVLSAGWILKLADYEIEPPSLLFIKVDQEQEIEINAVLTLKEG